MRDKNMADIIDTYKGDIDGRRRGERNEIVALKMCIDEEDRASPPSFECSIPAGTMTPRRGNKSDIWKRERSLAATRPSTIIESIEAETNRRRVPTSRLSLLLRYLGSWYLHFHRANHRRTGAVSRSVPPRFLLPRQRIFYRFPASSYQYSFFLFSFSLLPVP